MPRWTGVKFPMDMSDRSSPDYRSGPVHTYAMTPEDYQRMEATHMGRSSTLTVHQQTQLKALLHQGERPRKIADTLKIPEPTVRYYKSHWGSGERPANADVPPAADVPVAPLDNPVPHAELAPSAGEPDPVPLGPERSWDPERDPEGIEVRALAEMLTRCDACGTRHPIAVLRAIRGPRARGIEGPWDIVLCDDCRHKVAAG